MDKSDLSKLLDTLRRGASHDYIGLWEVIRGIKGHVEAEPATLKSLTLQFVGEMLSTGFVAGRSRGRKFEQWTDQRPERVVERIDREWSALDREPNIGDIVSFDIPDAS